jgi:hypothetical protein
MRSSVIASTVAPIEHASPEAADQQPQRPADLQAFPVADSAGHDLVNDRYAAVNAYPGEYRRFSVVSFWSAAKFALVLGERRDLG